MFEFIAVVVLANLIMLAVLYVLRHVIAIRAPVLILAVGISIIYCILYPFLVAMISYPQVLYLYVFLVVAGAGSLYLIENRFYTVGETGTVQEDNVFAQEEDGPSVAVDVREEIAPARYDAEKPADTGAIEYIPETGLPEYIEEAAEPAAGPVPADVPAEDMTVMAEKAAEGQITEDEVAALLKAAEAGETELAAEDMTLHPWDEIAAVEEVLPAGDLVGGDPVRDDFAAVEITATLEGLDETESHIGIEEFLPVEEESDLAYAEKTEAPGDLPVPVPGATEGLEHGPSGIAAAIQVEDVPVLADNTVSGDIAEDELAAILEDAVAFAPESAREDIPFRGPEELAAFAEGQETSTVPVSDMPGWDEATADEITATLEEEDKGEPVVALEDSGLTVVDVSIDGGFIEELLPVDHDPAEEATGEIAELMDPDDLPAAGQIPPGDDLNSLVAVGFDKLASGDGTGAADSFFRALKLGPPPRLAVLLCTRISSIYSSQGLNRQALAVMEMLEVVWGPMLDDSQRKGITTIIIQLRGEV